MTFDTIIRNGSVADGEGNPLQQADVGIAGDRIKAVGDLSSAEAERVIDAAGLVVAPGFIDVHNHAHNEVGGGILVIPKADNMLRQGVTTLVAGNCGGSPWPMDEHFREVEKLEVRQNYACLVGLNTVWAQVMKGAGRTESTELDRDRITALVAQAMREGALGVSAGYFPPSVKTADLIAGAKGAAAHGGVYASHIRSEDEGLLDAVREIIAVGEAAGLPVQISHFKTLYPGNWDKRDEAIRLVEEAHARGVEVLGDRYPYVASYGGIGSIAPAWARKKEGMAALSAEEAVRMRTEVDAQLERIGGADKVICAPWTTDEEIGGKTLAQVAQEQGRHPGDVVVDLAARGNVSAIRIAMCEENLKVFLAHPLVFVGSDGHLRRFGDGTSHPRNYGTFPRVLGKYVREEKIMSLEDAVKKMTSMPAKQFRLHDRGVLKEGAIADLCVFDPETVADQATFDDPHQYPLGIKHVFVNGGLAVEAGRTTERGFGRVIRK
ncbi:MAG: amidohydrolase family protein [Planctomycetes bacterium]|nr:amidohydrolase family protein [Planctomycetota bacterium]